MFSRGGPCLRSCRISSFLDSVTVVPTDEPLHFLYPRWFTSVLQQKHYSAFRATKSLNDSEKHHYLPYVRPRRPSVHTASRRWLSSSRSMSSGGSAQAPLCLTPSDSMSTQNNDRTNVTGDNGQRETHDLRADPGLSPGSAPASDGDRDRELTARSPNSAAVSLPSVDSSSNSIPIRKLRARSKWWTNSPSKRRLASKLRFQEKALLLVKNLSGRELMKFRYRRFILQWRLVTGKKAASVHWADVMSLLERLAQETHVWPKSTKHRVLHVPEETVAFLSGSTDLQENIWYVSIRNGCRIRVLDAAESEGPHRKVILSGTERALELVEKEIWRTQERLARGDLEMKKPMVPIIPSVVALQQRGLPVPTIRGVWRDHHDPELGFYLLKIPGPRNLSVSKFAEVVKDLVDSLPLLPKKRDRQAKDKHRYKIRDTLERLFLREANQQFFSTSALNTALSFLCSNEFLRSARIILSKAEAVASTETYNILLRSAARRQDIVIFHHILASMSRFHVRPNGQTWIAFLKCLISPGPKTHVMRRMTHFGYLEDRRTLEDAMHVNIGHMLSRHLDSGKDVPSFVRFIEEEYAPGILSTSLLNLMLDEVVTRKDLEAMKQLVDCFKQRQLSIDNATLNQVIRYFRDIDNAMSFLFRHVKLPRYPFDESNFEKLFLLAFKYQSYNACRVLWRYACMEGVPSAKMKQIVRSSLTEHLPGSRESPRYDAWRRTVGKVAVGLEYFQAGVKPSRELQDMVPPNYADNPVLYLLGSQPLDEKQVAVGKALVRRDVEAGREFEPVEPLEMMLDAALVLDRQWRGVSTSWPTIELLKNAIHVPVRIRGGRSKAPSHYSRIPT
ncbi:hypothetical protein VTN77DRAFT_9632 [Rasamsonia byssochlamydoides]|uniref:uncharacterized protein n=1 Tax=Rasamsonia byssochlamydoides TaxID=89139 RepID=UPI0037432587